MLRLKILMKLLNFWAWLTRRKCKFYDVCDIHGADNPTCTQYAGQYYGPGKYPGCYRRLEARIVWSTE